MPTIFSRIVTREIPGHFVAENEDFFAILDISPLRMGHVLVVPKEETDYVFDLDPRVISRLFEFAQRVAHAIRAVVPCKRIGLAVIGLEVPHAHIHLVPLDTMADINFSRSKLSPSQEELTEMAMRIRAEFNAAGRGVAL